VSSTNEESSEGEDGSSDEEGSKDEGEVGQREAEAGRQTLFGAAQAEAGPAAAGAVRGEGGGNAASGLLRGAVGSVVGPASAGGGGAAPPPEPQPPVAPAPGPPPAPAVRSEGERWARMAMGHLSQRKAYGPVGLVELARALSVPAALLPPPEPGHPHPEASSLIAFFRQPGWVAARSI
jgi:hypothetical protein